MFYEYPSYVSVADRRRQARLARKKLTADGWELFPIAIGNRRQIARSFWGKAWCEHLEQLGDRASRLPRGRSYVRNDSVIDLRIEPGTVRALVCGTDVYDVVVEILPLAKGRWRALVSRCTGGVGSIVSLLRGELSTALIETLTAAEHGLFPGPRELDFHCSCPDWAIMCKHVAAVMYGVGARLDDQPELFFTLRCVDQNDLVTHAATGAGALATPRDPAAKLLADDSLADLFGIELDGDDDLDDLDDLDDRAAEEAARAAARLADSARRIRAGKKLTAAQLLEYGLSRTTISRWTRRGNLRRAPERGVYKATRATRAALTAYLARKAE